MRRAAVVVCLLVVAVSVVIGCPASQPNPEPTPPEVDFGAAPVDGLAPFAVAFTSYASPGSDPITIRHWDFGDGQTSYEHSPTHVYWLPGTYTVTHTVTVGTANYAEAKTDLIHVGQHGWGRCYGSGLSDSLDAAILTFDGGVLYAARNRGQYNDRWDTTLYRTDAEGNLVWSLPLFDPDVKVFGPSVDAVVERSGAGFAVAMRRVYDRLSILEVDDSGGIEQQNDIDVGDVYIYRIVGISETASGGYVVAAQGSENGEYVLLLIRVDERGEVEWSKSYHEDYVRDASSMTVYPDGGVAIAASRWNGEGEVPYILRLDPDGEVLWDRAYDALGEWRNFVAATSDGGLILARGISDPATPYSYMPYLLRVNSQGEPVWEWVEEDGPAGRMRSVMQTSDGGYIATGSHTVFNEALQQAGDQLFVLRLNEEGEELWRYEYVGGFVSSEALSAVFERPGGDFLAVAPAYGMSTPSTVCVLAIDSEGRGPTLAERHVVEVP